MPNSNSNSKQKRIRIIHIRVEEEGVSISHANDITLNEVESALGALTCVIIANHYRRYGYTSVQEWIEQCTEAALDFLKNLISGEVEESADFYTTEINLK